MLPGEPHPVQFHLVRAEQLGTQGGLLRQAPGRHLPLGERRQERAEFERYIRTGKGHHCPKLQAGELSAWCAKLRGWRGEWMRGSKRQAPARPSRIARQSRRERLNLVKTTTPCDRRSPAPGDHGVWQETGIRPVLTTNPMKHGRSLVEWTEEHPPPGRIGDKLKQRHAGRFGSQVAFYCGVCGFEGLRGGNAKSFCAGEDGRPGAIIPHERISRRLQQ